MLKPHPVRINAQSVQIVPPEGYRSPMWYDARRNSVSASEIAVVCGVSPYDSPFNLWWSKHLSDTGTPENRQMSRGRRVEPLVMEDFEIAHPELAIKPCGLVQNVDRPYQVATPDGLAYERRGERDTVGPGGFQHITWTSAEPVAVIEAKTAGGGEGFGERGTDDVPVHYRAQVMWQMDTLGLEVTYMPVWVGFDYREYVIEYDRDDAEYMRERALAFLKTLEEGTPPEIDEHPATARRLKRMHPDVVEGAVEVPPAILAQYHAAKRLKEAAEDRMALAENRLRALVGDFQQATVDGRKVASRSVYDVPERVQTVKPYTVNRLNISKPKTPREDRSTTRRRDHTTP